MIYDLRAAGETDAGCRMQDTSPACASSHPESCILHPASGLHAARRALPIRPGIPIGL